MKNQMIKEFVNIFMANKDTLRAEFAKKHPSDYKELVTEVIKVISQAGPDPERIQEIDYGNYQGTLIYIIAEPGYQPYHHWSVKVSYGSCSGCDTLQSIRESSNYGEPPEESEIEQYMILALHIVQGLKEI